MTSTLLYPLRFQPIFRSALWGGRRLAHFFANAPEEGPLAEAWVLSDQGENVSRVTNGPLVGSTLREILQARGVEILGQDALPGDAFPLLLKFIDAQESLSVQVHPDDRLASELTGVARGKTEAWVVLRAETGSRIYAGLRPGVGRKELEEALAVGRITDCLHSFEPDVGDCIYLPAGTIHALGGGVAIFEVQQTSDTTYRLYDWDRVDAKTGKPRDLHVSAALECTRFDEGPRQPIRGISSQLPSPEIEHLIDCPYFDLHRYSRATPFLVGENGRCEILVGLAGTVMIQSIAGATELGVGDVLLCPVSLGQIRCTPQIQATILRCTPKGVAPC